MHRKLTGFSLVELLVVVAIIAMLIAILIPVLNKARSDAKAVVCASNVKQLLIALTIYETQNKTFPYGCDSNSLQIKGTPPGGWRNSNYDKQGWWWFHFISDFLGKDFDKKSVLWCTARSIRDPGTRKNILTGNYGVNQAICKNSVSNKGPESTGVPLRTTQVRHPANTFLLADSGYATIMWWYATDPDTLPGNPPRKISSGIMDDSAYVPGLEKANSKRLKSQNYKFRPGIESDALNGRHFKRGLNTGFVDGHVIRLKADDFYVLKVDNFYNNLAPLWMPSP